MKTNGDTDIPEENDNKTPSTRTAQSFNKFGLFEAINGNLVLRGRHGERDHIYPLERAVKKYEEQKRYAYKMWRIAMPGWDDMEEINKDFKFNILEAIKQRRSLNMPIPVEAIQFEIAHGDDPVIRVAAIGRASEPSFDAKASGSK